MSKVTAKQVIEFCAEHSLALYGDNNFVCEGMGNLKSLEEYIKPKLTPVDLSVLIDSGIDCEFSDLAGANFGNNPSINKLIGFTDASITGTAA